MFASPNNAYNSLELYFREVIKYFIAYSVLPVY